MHLGRTARTNIVALFLMLAIAVIYSQTRTFQFINLDDGSYVQHNRYVAGGLSVGNIVWAFTHRHAANWHPLTWISHMVDVQLFGLYSGGHHIVNAILHAFNGALLLILLARLTGRFWPSALTAAIFAVHPLRVESVAWIAERKDVLSGFFFLLTLLAYEQYVRRRLPGMFSIVALLFACGLMSKPMVVTLPAILLLLDYWPLDRVHLSQKVPRRPTLRGRPRDTFLVLVIEKIPLFILALVSCFITMWAQQTARELDSHVPIVARFQTAFSAYVAYLAQGFWPVNLSPFYPVSAEPISKTFLAIGVVIVVGVLALWLSRKRPYFIIGWLWFLCMLIPVIGIVPVGGQAHADRYTYLPLIGIYMAVAFGLADLFQGRAVPIRALASGRVVSFGSAGRQFLAAGCVLEVPGNALATFANRQRRRPLGPHSIGRHVL